MLVSLVIPVYNEIPTLAELLRRCIAVDFPKELVLIDDCSRDGSREFSWPLDPGPRPPSSRECPQGHVRT